MNGKIVEKVRHVPSSVEFFQEQYVIEVAELLSRWMKIQRKDSYPWFFSEITELQDKEIDEINRNEIAFSPNGEKKK